LRCLQADGQIAALQQNPFKEHTMTFNAEQLVAAHQANLNAAAGLSQTAFAGFERLVELNMAAGKAAVGESFANVQAMLSAKNPQDLLAAQTALVQPAFEKAVSYGRHLSDIANSTGAEFTKAVEGKFAESDQDRHRSQPKRCRNPEKSGQASR
jgi:phasin family protein